MSASKRTVWLKQPSSVKVKMKKGGKMTVTWLKQARVSGYQIRYGKTKKMKSAKTITVLGKRRGTAVKNLNKKTYYCKVRSMRKVGNTYYYSGWSAVKKGKRK